MSVAITMFVKQAVKEQRIPFEITRSNIVMASNTQVEELSQKLINDNIVAYKEFVK